MGSFSICFLQLTKMLLKPKIHFKDVKKLADFAYVRGGGVN